MFENLMVRVAARANDRAAEQARRIAARLAEALPGDVRAQPDADGVRLSGRGLKRRLALDPALKWTIMELRE